MKIFLPIILSLALTSFVYGQTTCPCKLPQEGAICNRISENGDGTCQSIPTPCNQCICDDAGVLECTVEEYFRLEFNGTGSQCSIQTSEKVNCPSILPDTLRTCCRLEGEGSSNNVPCTLQNWRVLAPGATLLGVTTTIETNASLQYTAENVDPATPGLASVSYDSGWTFVYPPGAPTYFDDYQAFSYFRTIDIPQGLATLSEIQELNNTRTSNLPGDSPSLFQQVRDHVGPLQFAASYTGITRTSNVPTIVATFSGDVCYEYIVEFPQ